MADAAPNAADAAQPPAIIEDDVATDLPAPPHPATTHRTPGHRRSRGRSATPLRSRSMTPLMLHQEKSNTPVMWRSITPFLDREQHEKTPFELGNNILLQLASYQAIFDQALVMDISQPAEKPAKIILSEHSALDRASIMDISCIEYVYVEDDDLEEDGTPAPQKPRPVSPPIVVPPEAVLNAPKHVGATPFTIVKAKTPPPPPPPVKIAPIVLSPVPIITVQEVLPVPPPTPAVAEAPVIIEPPVEVKKKRKMVRMTKKQRAKKRALKEKKRKLKEAAEKARKAEEARLAEEARKAEEERLAAEEEARRIQEEEEEEEERLRLEAEALAAAEEEEEVEGEDGAVIEEEEIIAEQSDQSVERFVNPESDLGKWNKLTIAQLQTGVVRGRYDRQRKKKMTEHERDKEWQRIREATRPPRIHVHLKDVSVNSGASAKLSCSVDGPSLIIKWYRDGEQLERTPKYRMLVSDGIISLEILKAVPNDTGRYRCRLVNENGEATSSASVTVHAKIKKKPLPPMFVYTKDYYHLHEDLLTIEAHCTGTPRPKVTWVRNVIELENTFKYSIIEEAHDVYKLEIYKPTHKDSGLYTIRAKNSVDTLECQYNVIFVKPRNYHLGVQSPHAGVLRGREEAALQAVDDALYAKEQYELIKSGGWVPPYRKPRQPQLAPSRLRFATQLRDRIAVTGQKVRFSCMVIGPDPDVHWLKDDKPIVYGRHVKSLTADGLSTLDIDKISLEMTGEYKCAARSPNCEEVSTSCYLRVFDARQEGDKQEPIFLLSIRDVHHTKENDLIIDCKVGGNPLPIVEWFKDEAPVELNERIQQVECADGQSQLIINSPTTADSGTYACRATNRLGTLEQSHPVVFTPPIIPVTGRRERAPKVEPAAEDSTEKETKELTRPVPKVAIVLPQVHISTEPARGTKTELFEAEPPSGGYKLSIQTDPVEYVRRHVVPSMKEIRNAARSKLSLATHLMNRVVVEGSKAKLYCLVLGPEPLARWTKDDVAIKYGSKYKNASGDGICGIEVLNCRVSDSGQYELTVKNQVSCLTSVCQLEVYRVGKAMATADVKPTFARNMRHVYHVDVNQLVLETRVRGEPNPTIEWSYNCMPIDKEMFKYKQICYPDGTVQLIINYPHLIDSGKYKCLAVNRAGECSCVHSVQFEGRDEYIAQNRVRMYLADKERIARARIEGRGGLPPPTDKYANVDGNEDETNEEGIPAEEYEEIPGLPHDEDDADADVTENGDAATAENAAEDGGADAEAEDEDDKVPVAPAGRVDAKGKKKKESIRFVTNLLDRVVAVGSKVKLTGYVEGTDCQVRWFKNDKKVPSTPKCRLTNTNGVLSLELRAAKEDDTGLFKVVARNGAGEVSSTCKLQVYRTAVGSDDKAPMFVHALRDVYNSKINELTVSCTVRGVPTPYIIWTKDRMPISANAKYQPRQLEDGTCELLVSFVDWKDMGTYVCKAENRAGKCQLSHLVDVKLRVPSHTKLYSSSRQSEIAEQTPQPDQQATSDQKEPPSERGPAEVKFRDEDEILGENASDDEYDSSRRVIEPLYERRHLPSAPPNPKANLHFATFLVNQTVPIGTRTKFSCFVDGPNPKCTWYKENPKTPDEPDLIMSLHKSPFRTEMHDGNAVLWVKKVAATDEGWYRLVARNDAGEIMCRASLTPYRKIVPHAKPIFVNSIKDSYNLHDDELTLECRVRAEPAAKVQWKLNNKTITHEINNRSKQVVQEDGHCRLIIAEPNETDNGEYTCVAINTVGKAKTLHNLQFEGREAHSLVKAYGFAHRDVKLPHILNHVGDHTVTKLGYVGLIVELQHEVTEVQWFFNGHRLLPWSSKVIAIQEYNVYTLVVPTVTADDAGTYMCRAINEFGRVESTGSIDVVGPMLEGRARSPQFLKRPPTEQLIATGDPFEFKVAMAGNPKPKLTLYKGLKDITRSERVIREQNEDHFRVSIENTDPSDSGTYWLVARNEHGTDRAFVTITVKLCKRRHKKRRTHEV